MTFRQVDMGRDDTSGNLIPIYFKLYSQSQHFELFSKTIACAADNALVYKFSSCILNQLFQNSLQSLNPVLVRALSNSGSAFHI